MIRCFALAGFALAVSITTASAAPAKNVFAPLSKAKAKNSNTNSKSHLHHLLQAEKDLAKAHHALATQNVQQAHKDVGAAIRQVEEAIHHHKTNHLSQTNSGLSGSFNRAQHQQHHSKLHEAISHMRAAEKQLKAGNGAAASHDIKKAEHEISSAISSHKQLIK